MGDGLSFFEVAERVAVSELRRRGFDARLTGSGPDGGLDVVDDEGILAAQVKALSVPVSRPTLQQLFGAAAHFRSPRLACFSINGFTGDAASYADTVEMAIFRIDLAANVTPLNRYAIELRRLPDPDPATILAATSGELQAMLDAADFWENERGDLVQAEGWLRNAVAAGSGRAMIRLGCMMEDQERDGEALSLYFMAYQAGYPTAPEWIGLFYVTRNYVSEALPYLRQGAEAGDHVCMAYLSQASQDISEKRRWCMAAAAAGSSFSTMAMRDLAEALDAAGQCEEARVWRENAAAWKTRRSH